jgi:hypothetical protein
VQGATVTLGRTAREELGGVEHIAAALRLARGTGVPRPDQVEAAQLLETAARLRQECLGEAV